MRRAMPSVINRHCKTVFKGDDGGGQDDADKIVIGTIYPKCLEGADDTWDCFVSIKWSKSKSNVLVLGMS